jgi:hypothetical protein
LILFEDDNIFENISGRRQHFLKNAIDRRAVFILGIFWGEISPPKVPTSPAAKFFELDLNFCLFQCDFPSKNS